MRVNLLKTTLSLANESTDYRKARPKKPVKNSAVSLFVNWQSNPFMYGTSCRCRGAFLCPD